ncbi:MAG: imidazoleglycerol-phosphate dehydratase HisB [Chloroflexi bacterium]|nr:imidazoleglycerol-phosphate dehydratase HisB [Chloroflexota bacterium]
MSRSSKVRRETGETRVAIELELDGSGQATVTTGIGMLNHLLAQIARHGLLDLTVEATGDLDVDPHHLVEDVGITLGRALREALGNRAGLVRMGHALVPMDEALVMVAVDLSGRPFAAVEAPFTGERIGALPVRLVHHFLRSFAFEALLTLHARVLAGEDDHHMAEALMKALGRAMGAAVARDPRLGGAVPSTKGTLDA